MAQYNCERTAYNDVKSAKHKKERHDSVGVPHKPVRFEDQSIFTLTILPIFVLRVMRNWLNKILVIFSVRTNFPFAYFFLLRELLLN